MRSITVMEVFATIVIGIVFIVVGGVIYLESIPYMFNEVDIDTARKFIISGLLVISIGGYFGYKDYKLVKRINRLKKCNFSKEAVIVDSYYTINIDNEVKSLIITASCEIDGNIRFVNSDPITNKLAYIPDKCLKLVAWFNPEDLEDYYLEVEINTEPLPREFRHIISKKNKKSKDKGEVTA